MNVLPTPPRLWQKQMECVGAMAAAGPAVVGGAVDVLVRVHASLLGGRRCAGGGAGMGRGGGVRLRVTGVCGREGAAGSGCGVAVVFGGVQ